MATKEKAAKLLGFRDLGERLEFDYESSEGAGKGWTVATGPEGESCGCIGFVNHGHCYHADDAKLRAAAHRGSTGWEVVPTAPTPLAPNRSIQRRDRMVMIPTPDELNGMIKLASALAMAAGTAIPEQFDTGPKAFAALFWGWERDVPMMTVFAHCLIVNGKIEPDAQLMMGLIQRERPGTEWRWIIEPSEAEGAHVELWIDGKKRSDGKWTPADALKSKQLSVPTKRRIEKWDKSANGKSFPVFAKDSAGNFIIDEVPGNWQLWPTRMYAWSAVKIASRLGASDVINGLTALAIGGDLMVETTVAPALAYGGVRDAFEADPFAAAAAETAPAAAAAPTAAETASEAPPAPQDGPKEPEPAPQAVRAGEYPWMAPLQDLRAAKYPAVDDADIGAIVKAEGPDILAAIDRWIFSPGGAVDIPERVHLLLRQATRWQLDQLDRRPPTRAQASMLPEEDENGFPR